MAVGRWDAARVKLEELATRAATASTAAAVGARPAARRPTAFGWFLQVLVPRSARRALVQAVLLLLALGIGGAALAFADVTAGPAGPALRRKGLGVGPRPGVGSR